MCLLMDCYSLPYKTIKRDVRDIQYYQDDIVREIHVQPQLNCYQIDNSQCRAATLYLQEDIVVESCAVFVNPYEEAVEQVCICYKDVC